MNEDLNVFSYQSLYNIKDIKPEEYEILFKRGEVYIRNLKKFFNDSQSSEEEIRQEIKQQIIKEFLKE